MTTQPALFDRYEPWAWVHGAHRYALGRRWGDGDPCLWVMLNPSTADASRDDPTLRRVCGFSRRWGFDAAVVVNLYSWRSADPRDLVAQADHAGHESLIGPSCDEAIRNAVSLAACVVVAWGAASPVAGRAWHRARVSEVRGLLPRLVDCIGTTKDGAPKHPLYVRGDAERAAWPQDGVTP